MILSFQKLAAQPLGDILTRRFGILSTALNPQVDGNSLTLIIPSV
jgi:hypothetical protein